MAAALTDAGAQESPPPRGSGPPWRDAALRLLVLLAAGAAFAFDAGARALWEPDEVRYAEIPRELLATGDLLTPHLNGLPYYEKPPLHAWLTAAAQAAFGSADAVNRIVPCLASLLLVAAAMTLATRWWSARA